MIWNCQSRVKDWAEILLLLPTYNLIINIIKWILKYMLIKKNSSKFDVGGVN